MIRQKVKGEYRMLLQKLLWPRVGICTEDRLYYRMKAPSFRDEGDILRIEQGERVCFDTYFNSVSADKWRRYTAAQNFSLRLKLSGKLRAVQPPFHQQPERARRAGRKSSAGRFRAGILFRFSQRR